MTLAPDYVVKRFEGSRLLAFTRKAWGKGGQSREAAKRTDPRFVVPGGDGCGSGPDVPGGSRSRVANPTATSSAGGGDHRRRYGRPCFHQRVRAWCVSHR